LSAEGRTELSPDGKFFVRVWAGDEPYCLMDGDNSVIPESALSGSSADCLKDRDRSDPETDLT